MHPKTNQKVTFQSILQNLGQINENYKEKHKSIINSLQGSEFTINPVILT